MEVLGLVLDRMDVSMSSQKLRSCIAEFSPECEILGNMVGSKKVNIHRSIEFSSNR